MNLNHVISLYEIIKSRLPKTYPRPKLAFFEDEQCMMENTGVTKDGDDENVYAVITPQTETINLPMKMLVEMENKAGETIKRWIPITKQEDYEIIHTLLHELAHNYFGERYGYESKQYSDERACDEFAYRWMRVMLKEHLI